MVPPCFFQNIPEESRISKTIYYILCYVDKKININSTYPRARPLQIVVRSRHRRLLPQSEWFGDKINRSHCENKRGWSFYIVPIPISCTKDE